MFSKLSKLTCHSLLPVHRVFASTGIFLEAGVGFHKKQKTKVSET
jgi:hypothetical protein